MPLTDGLLVPTPSKALGPRGSQQERGFLGLSALLFLHADFQALLPVPSGRNKNANNEGPQSHIERAPPEFRSSSLVHLSASDFAFSDAVMTGDR